MAYSRGVSEGSILFYSGGHNHNGTSSALIATEAYSIYDFIVGFAGSNERQIKQQNNFNNLKTVISNVIKTDVLGPSGVRLLPNSVQSIHISAGSITADELSANIVLVNNIISSNNYVTGVSGWAINSNGTAEFANTSIRGAIVANSVSTPGIVISNTGNLTANNFALYSNGQIQNGNFSVSPSGVLTATGATISGNVDASEVSTPGVNIDSAGNLTAPNFALYANGAIYGSGGNFQVNTSGNLTATGANISGTISSTSGAIAGWVIGSDTISASGGEISLYQEPGYGAVIAGTGAGTQIILNSEAQLHAEFDGVTTDINYQTDSAYVFRIANANNVVKISPTLVTAERITGVAMFSFMSYDGFATLGESSADHFVDSGGTAIQNNANGTAVYRRNSDGRLMKAASKRELKKDIANIENSIDLIQKINPVSFRWKDESSLDYFTSEIREIIKSKKEYGFIAEDVEHEISELAVYDTNKDGSVLIPSMWQQNGMIALCVGSIKELLSKINTLEGRIQELENEV